jgi:hypothetical protein
MTREWKYPPIDGFTVHHITDTHIEEPGRATPRVEAIRKDMANLPQSLTHNQVTVHTGDLYHNMYASNSTLLDWPVAEQFLADVQSHDPSPLVYSVGNHELWTHQDGDAVAQHFGMPGRNYTVSYGPIKFIVYAAKNDAEDGNGDGGGEVGDWTVPDAVLDWIEDEIDSTPDGMVAALVSHCGPKEQFGYLEAFSLEPAARISSILSDHPKLVAWFTGHLHHWYDDPNDFKVLDFTTHSVALIHGGACGGALPASQRQDSHPVEAVRNNGSVYATYFGPESGSHRWEIRIRDHDTQTWGTQSTGYQYLFTLPLMTPPVLGELDSTATSGMELAGDVIPTVYGEFAVAGVTDLQLAGQALAASPLTLAAAAAMSLTGETQILGEFALAGDSSIRIHVPAIFTVITSYSYLVG